MIRPRGLGQIGVADARRRRTRPNMTPNQLIFRPNLAFTEYIHACKRPFTGENHLYKRRLVVSHDVSRVGIAAAFLRSRKRAPTREGRECPRSKREPIRKHQSVNLVVARRSPTHRCSVTSGQIPLCNEAFPSLRDDRPIFQNISIWEKWFGPAVGRTLTHFGGLRGGTERLRYRVMTPAIVAAKLMAPTAIFAKAITVLEMRKARTTPTGKTRCKNWSRPWIAIALSSTVLTWSESLAA